MKKEQIKKEALQPFQYYYFHADTVKVFAMFDGQYITPSNSSNVAFTGFSHYSVPAEYPVTVKEYSGTVTKAEKTVTVDLSKYTDFGIKHMMPNILSAIERKGVLSHEGLTVIAARARIAEHKKNNTQ